MPQMFPMNWWLVATLPFIMILTNMIFTQFIFNTKNNKKMMLNKNKTFMMNWKW